MHEVLITRKQAAEMMAVTDRTIDNYLKDKKLTRVKFGNSRQACCRIKLAEVQKLINPEPANAV